MPRGRPRKFDEDQALNGAMLLFWERGLTAASLDDLSKAMGMNRPSIYNAFGDKEAIYAKALARFCEQLNQGIADTLESVGSLEEGLVAFFDRAIDVYCGANPAMGCFMVCTAPAEAFNHPEIGRGLKDLMKRLDQSLADRLRRAQNEGDLSEDIDAGQTAKLLQATLQTIALRARTGTAKRELRRIARYAVERLIA